jgi:hypothetical protein
MFVNLGIRYGAVVMNVEDNHMGRDQEDVARLSPIQEPGVYRIRVAGRLGPGWADRVGGMEIRVREEGARGPVTELSGTVVDQAALQGLLDQLYARGYALLGVELLSEGGRIEDEA